MNERRFVVTGCSRSGTKYMANLLSAIGFACGHEKIFHIYRVFNGNESLERLTKATELRGDSSFLAVPFLQALPAGTVVLHQVRHPVAVIRSHMGIRFFADPFEPSMYLADNHPDFLRFLERHCPDIFAEKSELLRCMNYWVRWNRMAQRAEELMGLHYLRYPIEEIGTPLLERIVTRLGGQIEQPVLDSALSSVSKSMNSRLRDDSVMWETIPASAAKEAVRQLAVGYGYPLP